jgi:hypothetical protein
LRSRQQIKGPRRGVGFAKALRFCRNSYMRFP